MTAPSYDPFALRAGGMIQFHYGRPGIRQFNVIQLYVAQFVSDADNGFPYYGENCLGFPGSAELEERTLIETATNFGAVWAPYYVDNVVLNLRRIFQTVDGSLRLVSDPDMGLTVARGAITRRPGRTRFSLRAFGLVSTGAVAALGRWSAPAMVLELNQLRWTPAGYHLNVSPAAGGYDWRDRAVMRYLSGTRTGICGQDCTRLDGAATMNEWTGY